MSDNDASLLHAPELQYTPAPEDHDDPSPPGESCTQEEMIEYREEVASYSRSMLECFEQDSRLMDEEPRIDFTSTFRKETIRVLTASQKSKWIALLRSRGVFVRKERGISRNKALVDCLEANSFPQLEHEKGDSVSLAPAQELAVRTNPSAVQPGNDLTSFPSAST